MRVTVASAVGAVLALSASGCILLLAAPYVAERARQPTRLYAGAPLPPSQVSLISGGADTFITELDGQQGASPFEVLPGPHTAKLSVHFSEAIQYPYILVYSWETPAPIDLMLEAGHEYVVQVYWHKVAERTAQVDFVRVDDKTAGQVRNFTQIENPTMQGSQSEASQASSTTPR